MANFANPHALVQSWYPAVRSRRLRVGEIVPFAIAGRRLVAFREPSGRARVLDARCAHMGADLRHGRVEGDGVVCALHGWRWGVDGACATEPARRLRAYPTVERFGHVFFFHGPEPTHALPEPFYGGKGRVIPMRVEASKAHVHLLTGNPLDATHFGPLHRTDLLEATVTQPDKHRVRVQLRARVRGGWARRIPGLGSRDLRATFTSHGASVCVVEVTEPFAYTILFAGRPRAEGGTDVHPIFVMPPGRAWDLPRAIALTLALTNDDEPVLADLDFLPGFTERDAGFRVFHDAVNEMPCW